MPFVLLTALLSSTLTAAPPEGYRGKKITVVEAQARVVDLLGLLAEVSKLNIVLLDVPPTAALDLDAEKEPWDQLLDEVLQRSGLTGQRQGNVVLVGTAERIAAHPRRKYTGKRLSVGLTDADARGAVELIARHAGLSRAATGGRRTLSLTLRNVPADQAIDLLLELAQASAAPIAPAPRRGGCAAPKSPAETLRLAGTLWGDARPEALLVDAQGQTFIVERLGCVSADALKVTTIRRDGLVTAGPLELTAAEGWLARDRPRTREVSLDDAIAVLERPAALAGTGRVRLGQNTARVLRFARDVLGVRSFSEPANGPAHQALELGDLGARMGAAILANPQVSREAVAAFANDELQLWDCPLLPTFRAEKLGDGPGLLRELTGLVVELEADAATRRELSELEGELPPVDPQPAEYVLRTLPRLVALGVPAEAAAPLEKRARASLLAR